MSHPKAIYQQMSQRYFRWWCKSHKREGNYLRLMPRPYITAVVCDPNKGGIMLPCDCELVSNSQAEIGL